MTVLVGTTMAAFVTDDDNTCMAWLRNAEAIQLSHPGGVHYFCAFEVDGRGMDPFAKVTGRLSELGGDWWSYSLNDGRNRVTTANRLRHITVGQNLCMDRAVTDEATHLLFLAADLEPPADALPKLLEMDHPLVAGEVTTYCLHGQPVDSYPFPVEDHMGTAAFLLLRHEVFTRLRFRWDHQHSDDPAMHADAVDLLGIPTYVRKDCVGRHYPEQVPAIENRGHADMRVVW